MNLANSGSSAEFQEKNNILLNENETEIQLDREDTSLRLRIDGLLKLK